MRQGGDLLRGWGGENELNMQTQLDSDSDSDLNENLGENICARSLSTNK